MIIGHYAVGFAASRFEPRLPVWLATTAVVWLDILHASLVIAGVEVAVVVPGITAVVPIDLRFYPYSHSLVASLLWSLLAFVVFTYGGRGAPRPRVGMWIALCVFSHFVLDFVTHRPDLPLVTGEPKLGLGLWHSVIGTYALENLLLFGSYWLYVRGRPSVSRTERVGLLSLCVVGSALFFLFPVTPFPDDIRYTEAFSLFVYGFVPLVMWLTRTREPQLATRTVANLTTSP